MRLERIYLWYGYDNHGALSQGEIVATSTQQVKRALILQGILPIKLRRGPRLAAREWHLSYLIIVTRQLATMLQAGLPLANSLRLLATEHPRPAWRYVLNQLQLQVVQGNSLSDALANYPQIFPASFRELVATGELTGELDNCCLQLAEQQERLFTLYKQLKKALRYPLFIMIVTILVTLLMLIFVLPEFSAIYDSVGAQLPGFTLWIMGISTILQKYAAVGLPVVVMLVLYYRFSCHPQANWQQREDRLLLRLPLWGELVACSCLARIFRTLTMTQRAGITLPEGLKTAANSANNTVYRSKVMVIYKKIEQGLPFYLSLEQDDAFPALARQLISVGEASGTLELMLAKLADIYEQQTQEITESLSQKLEPVLMLILGIVVGGLVIAMYLPLFQLGNVMT